MRRVAVTGYGAISPIGLSAKANWESLMAGRTGIGRITLFDSTGYTSRIAGEVRFSPEKYFSVKEIKRMDRFIQLCLIAGTEAMADSGLNLEKESGERMGACVGVGIGGLPEIQAQHREILERGPRRVTPFFIPMVVGNLAAGHLSIKYGLKGPNTCITTACSSSAHAIGESLRYIQRGDVDVMMAGGAEAVICESAFGGFCSMRALSQRNDEPGKASRPFDRDRDGFVMGEGSAVLVLEEWDHALARGARIHAEIAGYGINSDAHHITQPSPSGEGAARCMALALSDAKMDPTEIGYINAHGTSTPLGDSMETEAIKKIFGDWAYRLAVSSTKSMTGHLLGAAGALETMFCVQAIENHALPPTINLDSPSPNCDLNYVAHEPQAKAIRAALTNSFGFGGTNASLVVKAASG